MNNNISQDSLDALSTCHDDIQLVIRTVARNVPLVVTWGFRDMKTQNRFYRKGKSQLQWPESRHNEKPSKAVDAYPVVDGEVPWGDTHVFYHFAGYVRATAEQMGIPLRSGADWDEDFEFDDQEFDDLGHFELIDE